MIVRTLADGSLMMIAQNDHARLSGVLAAHWGNDAFDVPRPYESAVRAAILHDCGWYRYEANPLFDAASRSTPSFMQVPLDPVQLGAFQWATDWVTEIDPYAGLLVNRHRTGLWRARYGAVQYPVAFNAKDPSPALLEFIARNEAEQERQMKGVDAAEFWTNYRLLQAFDLLSLYFCTGEPKPDRIEFVPMRYGGAAGVSDDGTRLTLQPEGDGRVSIRPYPFDVSPLPVAFAYRHLPRATFADREDFRRAYYGAPPQLAHFTFV